MNKLLHQIIKFGIVGVLCFCIDFAIVVLLNSALNVHYIIATFFGFTISVIVNYLLSMKYVFTRKEELDRKKEFVAFVILSVMGLGLNEVIMLFCMEVVYANWNWIETLLSHKMAVAGSKIFATGIVMVFNFVTRKIFLEQKAS